MKLTLDTNCVIDLEENRPEALPLRELVQMSSEGILQFAVVGISASENKPGGGGSPTFSAFQEKVVRVGLASAEILKPMGIWGVTYWDWCVYADDGMEGLAEDIHRILFPRSEYGYADYCAARGLSVDGEEIDRTWRNRMCDVLALWCHIHYRRDIFVTRDGNFLASTKRRLLESMGGRVICSPTDAISTVRQRLAN
ncbi:MAG: hypothetical protein AB1806_13950 [Acidobacteriota bacterium]